MERISLKQLIAKSLGGRYHFLRAHRSHYGKWQVLICCHYRKKGRIAKQQNGRKYQRTPFAKKNRISGSIIFSISRKKLNTS
jgi:hypothetical protein